MKTLLNKAAVKYTPLGDVIFPTTNIKWDVTDRAYRYIDLTSVDVDTKSITKTSEITVNNAPSRAQKLVEQDDVIFATTRPTQQRYCLIDEKYAGEIVSSGYCVLRANPKEVLPKWIMYCISSTRFKIYVGECQSGATYPAISDSKVKLFPVPIPCPDDVEKSLAIQGEIVRILDRFTELTTELTTELNARKTQYKYYLNRLFALSQDKAQYLPMGERGIGTFIRGVGLQKKDFIPMGVGCIHYGQVHTCYGTYAHNTETFVSEKLAEKLRTAKPGDLVIATISENDEDVGKAVAWLGSDDIAVSSDICIYRHTLHPKYVSYFFQTEQFQRQKRQYITGTKVKRINTVHLAKILIPIPSKEEQQRIVTILDKFDALTTSLTEGLPREIALRQKQYAYYRDLLLNFPKPDTKIA